jgi:hypothetical protein
MRRLPLALSATALVIDAEWSLGVYAVCPTVN